MTKSQEPYPQPQPEAEPTHPTITLVEAMLHHALASYRTRLAATEEDPTPFRPAEGYGRPMGLRTRTHQHDGGGRRTSAELRQLVRDVITQVQDECATDRAGATTTTTTSSSSGSGRSGSSRSYNSSRRNRPAEDEGGPTTN